jgi:phosphoglycolate phosphatase-like HAD superfamily hydrolase
VCAASLWLFDFDNTLARLEPEVDWAASRRELEPMLRSAGAPEPLFTRFPKGNLLLYDAYREHLGEMVHTDGGAHIAILRDASAIIEKFELRGVERAAPLEGALEIVRLLDLAKHHLGVVTSNSSRTVKRWLDLQGLSKMVKTVVGRDSLLPLKPAPDMILEALRVADTTPSEAGYIGDSPADSAAARSAGVAFYGVASSRETRASLASAGTQVVFRSLTDLATHLNLDRPAARN